MSDSGIGIPGEQLARLFQPFQQLDSSARRRHGGTGLGLVISRHLVRMLNGDLFVGQGSELIARTIGIDYPVYNLHKVYLDLYPQLSVSAGQRSPEANRAIDQSGSCSGTYFVSTPSTFSVLR